MRGVAPYYHVEFVTSLALGTIIPVDVLYFRHHHIDLLQIGLLAATFEATIILFELPTGMVADLYGRRLSVILSLLFLSLAGFTFAFSSTFSLFVIAGVIQGIGETLKSGALEAWVVDSLREQGDEDRAGEAFARGTRCRQTGLLLGVLAGGYIGSFDISMVWYPFGIAHLLMGVHAIVAMKERHFQRSSLSIAPLAEMRRMVKRGTNVVRGQRLLLALFLLTLMANFSYETVDQYWQVHFSENLAIDARYFGWVMAAASALVILLVGTVTALFSRMKRQGHAIVLIDLGIVAATVTLALAVSPALGVTMFIVLKTSRGFKNPILLNLLNRLIPSPLRATMLSFQSLVHSIGESLSGVIMGMVALSLGVRWALGIGALLLLGGIWLLLILPKKHAGCLT